MINALPLTSLSPDLLSRQGFRRFCTALALFLVAVLLLLEPFGTAHFQDPWRTLKLAGYGLCLAIPGLVCHGLCTRLRPGISRRSVAGLEWALLMLWVLLAIFLSYLYSAHVIAPRALSWKHGLAFGLRFGLPLLLLLSPVLLWWRAIRPAPRPLPGCPWEARPDRQTHEPPVARLVLRGRNRSEVVELDTGQFLYAQAQQNYVRLVWWDGSARQEQLLRITLSALAEQLPQALRLHRSYLVAGEHLLGVEGPRRQRQARLRHVDELLPASGDFVPPQQISSPNAATGP